MTDIKTQTERDTAAVKAYVAVVYAVMDAIKELKSVPSGELYAHVMGVVNIQVYQQILDILTKAKKIKVENHLITWIGE